MALAENIEATRDPVAQARGVQFIASLNGLLKGVKLYPLGHPMLAQITEKFFTTIAQLIGGQQQVVLRIYHSQLHIFDQLLPAAQAPEAEGLIREMQKRGVRQIIFKEPLADIDLNSLMQLFVTPEETIEAAGGAREFIRQTGAAQLEIIEYYTPHRGQAAAEKTGELHQGDLFRLLAADDWGGLAPEQLRELYTLTQAPEQCAAFLKDVLQARQGEQAGAGSSPEILFELLKKIQKAFTEAGLSEEQEMNTILKNLLPAMGLENMFDLALSHLDDAVIAETGILESALDQVGEEKVAGMIATKLATENTAPIRENAKRAVGRLFPERQAMQGFVPLFQKELDKQAVPGAEEIIADLTNSFGLEVLQAHIPPLAMGSVATTDQNVLAQGLNSLLEVELNLPKLQKWVTDFDIETNHLHLLNYMLHQQITGGLRQNLIEQVLSKLRHSLEEEEFKRAAVVVAFLFKFSTAEDACPEAEKNHIMQELRSIKSDLWKKLLLQQLLTLDETEAAEFMQQMQSLLSDSLAEMVLHIYLDEDGVTDKPVLQQILKNQLEQGGLVLPGELRSVAIPTASRLLDLYERYPVEKNFPQLWKITFHENKQLAQRALQLIVQNQHPVAATYLLKALEHNTLFLRLLSIELLAKFNQPEVKARLIAIARGTDPCLMRDIALQMRLAALESLKALDQGQFRSLLVELRRRRKFLFFATEPATIITYARQQLRLRG